MEKKPNEIDPFYFSGIERKKYKFEGYEKTSQFVTMRDGVKIAIEVISPKNLSPNEKLSTILMQTRYWRDSISMVHSRSGRKQRIIRNWDEKRI
jgi:predicted acyl esterase